jgi:hypothetical protein
MGSLYRQNGERLNSVIYLQNYRGISPKLLILEGLAVALAYRKRHCSSI